MILTAAGICMADASLRYGSLEESATENVSNPSKMLSSVMAIVKHWDVLELNVSSPGMGSM